MGLRAESRAHGAKITLKNIADICYNMGMKHKVIRFAFLVALACGLGAFNAAWGAAAQAGDPPPSKLADRLCGGFTAF